MCYTIYLRTNLVNGKQYVGQTSDWETREKQFNRINQRYANKELTKARKEFGLDNFDVKILNTVNTQDEAWNLEKHYIKEFNTKYPNGYNMSDGGKTSKGTKHTDDTIKNFSETAKRYWSCHISPSKGVPVPNEMREAQSIRMKNFYKEHPEYLEQMSERGKKLVGEKNPFYGHHHTEEYKKNKSEKSKGKHYSKSTEFPSKIVYKYDLDGNMIDTYQSTAEAARQNGCSQSAISWACKGHKMKNFIWSFTQL